MEIPFQFPHKSTGKASLDELKPFASAAMASLAPASKLDHAFFGQGADATDFYLNITAADIAALTCQTAEGCTSASVLEEQVSTTTHAQASAVPTTPPRRASRSVHAAPAPCTDSLHHLFLWRLWSAVEGGQPRTVYHLLATNAESRILVQQEVSIEQQESSCASCEGTVCVCE